MNGVDDLAIVVMSCDKYKCLTDGFMECLDKYYPNHPEVHFVYGDGCWSKRYREALKNIKEDYVLTMLDDFYVRNVVKENRIIEALNILKNNNQIAVCNFEKQYREGIEIKWNGTDKQWECQKNNQVYLCSTQPSLWNKKHLIELLQENKNPWEWETTKIDSPYLFFINTGDLIIDVGYRHQPLEIGWGITRGKITNEFKEFLKREEIDMKWLN